MNATDLPKTFPINHDDDHAEFIGRLPDGRQFFITAPFIPKRQGDLGCEFISLFYFDHEGKFLEAEIDNLGPRETMDEDFRAERFQAYLDEVAEGEFTNIEVAPFEFERFCTRFGFIPHELEDGGWTIEFHPGNFMAFFEPWDGEYYT